MKRLAPSNLAFKPLVISSVKLVRRKEGRRYGNLLLSMLLLVQLMLCVDLELSSVVIKVAGHAHVLYVSSGRRVMTSPDPHLKSNDRGLSFDVSLLHRTI
jgi:hypothetical protein